MKIARNLILCMLTSTMLGCKNAKEAQKIKSNHDVKTLLNKEYLFSKKEYLYRSPKINPEKTGSHDELIGLYVLKSVKFDVSGHILEKQYIGTSVEDGYKNQFDVCDNINDKVIEELGQKIKENPSLNSLESILGKPDINTPIMEESLDVLHMWSIANLNDLSLYQIIAGTNDEGKIEFCLVMKADKNIGGKKQIEKKRQ